MASLYAQCCSSLLSFWYALNASSLAVIARRVSSFNHRLSFSLYAPFPLVCHTFSLAVDTKISCNLFQSGSFITSSVTRSVCVICFLINAPGMGSIQLLNLGFLGYGLELRFWVVIAIIVSLTLTITLITTVTII